MRREKRRGESEARYRADQMRKRAAKHKKNPPSHPYATDNSSSLCRGELSAAAGFLTSGK
jgi:hypothetical protein